MRDLEGENCESQPRPYFRDFHPARKRERCSRLGVRAAWIFSVALLALTFFSCTNNLAGKLSTSSVATIGVGTGGTNSTGTFALTLQNVLRDSTNPTTTLDLIGDGTNKMGTLCTSTAGGLSTAGPSTCSCTYAYTSPSVGVQSVDVPTVYQESNLIECLSTTIPSDVTTVSVSVHVTSENEYSNVVAFNLLNTGGLNPTSASSFSLVQRWQCRDILWIPYPGPNGTLAEFATNSMYDPIQSQDPSLTYPINFYTTNLGGTLQAYINANIAGQWDCPSNPNDPNFGLNYNLFSVGPDSGGSYQISPTAGSAFDRSDVLRFEDADRCLFDSVGLVHRTDSRERRQRSSGLRSLSGFHRSDDRILPGHCGDSRRFPLGQALAVPCEFAGSALSAEHGDLECGDDCLRSG